MMLATTTLLVQTLVVYGTAQSLFSPKRPPAIPLAVRSPYLNVWQAAGLDGGNGGYLAGQWPSHWSGNPVGWSGLIRVDGRSYTWMGQPNADLNLPTANQTAFSYTSTRSTFIMDIAGSVSMNVTFLSPVVPNDLLRQSIDASYLEVQIQSSDGRSHNVSLYTDISAEWTSANRSQQVQWKYGVEMGSGSVEDNLQERSVRGHARELTQKTKSQDSDSGIAYHQIWTTQQQEFVEENQQAAWGTWYYATANVQGLTYQSGADVDVRSSFESNGKLANTEDPRYRAIDDHYPVFGFATDLGAVGDEFTSTLFTINLMQDHAVQFADVSGTNSIPSLWTSYLDHDLQALAFFYNDFANVSKTCNNLDAKISLDSNTAAGQDYAAITSLGLRQAWGALKLAGTPEKPYIFLKEISSNGDCQTVDVIYPMFPMLLYLNPAWLRYLLDPLYSHQEAGLWPHNYSIHDLGIFPKATGYPDGNAEQQPLEECGNMLVMTLAYAQATTDTSYLEQHYSLLQSWTQYLLNDSLTPGDQISTDDFAGSLVNQTNLALKGMIGIQAMAVVANLTDHQDEASQYSSVAHDYISQWQTLGVNKAANPPHTTLNYGNQSSWGLLYNLYADALLNTQLVPKSVYQMQSDFYPTAALRYGVPLDTRHTFSKNDWEMWVAAISDEDTRDLFVTDMAKWLGETSTSGPATDLLDADTGDYADGLHFAARPVVGGWFSMLALKQLGVPS
ncbi:DUF1793-domain-containing protein, partial [Polychaeton citri CBS 116435]